MNIILILVDSLNKEALRFYNREAVCKTPNLDRLAAKSLVFDNHFVSSLPCMPARREITAGRKEFMWRPWGPLEIFDSKLPREIQSQGYNTGLVTDHYHYWEESANGYMQGFMSLEMIRGHETDYYKVPSDGPVPAWVEKMCEFRSPFHMRQYYENVRNFRGEEDFFPAKTFSEGCRWLDQYADRGPFFLQVESFDVHEPFHVPEPYSSMYSEGIEGSSADYNIWPPYQIYSDLDAFMEQTTTEELAFIRSQYYGKTTMVDAWLGRFMGKLDDLGIWDDTIVLFTTDHGHDLGERGAFGKQYPHWDSHANIPLLLWHPRFPGEGRRISALTQTVDLHSTLVEASGGQPPQETTHSKSILPLLDGRANAIRNEVVYGTFGQGVCISDGEWTLFKSPIEGKPLYFYSTMITRPLIVDNPVDGRLGTRPARPEGHGYFDATVPYPLWKLPIEIDPRTYDNFLFDRANDPEQTRNLWECAPGQRDRMMRLLRNSLEEEGYPAEQRDRLGL
ncbi:MAG: sulfatase [Albidovulum sp.]|nr:sulfatase [Albidovulum sp.]